MVSETIANYVIKLYEVLENESVEGVFQGSLARSFDSIGASRTYYGRCWTILIDLTCVSVLSKGYGKNPSVVQLHQKPELADIQNWATSKGPTSDKSVLEARVIALENKIGGLNIPLALKTVQASLRAIEDRLTNLEGTPVGVDKPPQGV